MCRVIFEHAISLFFHQFTAVLPAVHTFSALFFSWSSPSFPSPGLPQVCLLCLKVAAAATQTDSSLAHLDHVQPGDGRSPGLYRINRRRGAREIKHCRRKTCSNLEIFLIRLGPDPDRGPSIEQELFFYVSGAEQSRNCCKNGGTCILGSFCACPPFFTGRSCEYDTRIRRCDFIPHGEWVQKGCSYCRCFYGILHCFPHMFNKDCGKNLLMRSDLIICCFLILNKHRSCCSAVRQLVCGCSSKP
uniref:EGF-like domain-containing protein n=1 Tax=Cyprinodon variegatus TaxID=28743 RepID=A0A3Q2DWT9_CYPVA